jgi:hypothetical protein
LAIYKELRRFWTALQVLIAIDPNPAKRGVDFCEAPAAKAA